MSERLWIIFFLAGVFLTACGGDDTDKNATATAAQLRVRNYGIQISGDVVADIAVESASAVFLSEPVAHYELTFEEAGYTVFFTLSERITLGTYRLEAYDESLQDQLAAVRISVPDNAGGTVVYGTPVTGSIILDQAKNTFGGSFDFNATFIDTGVNQQEVRKTIRVIGTFKDLKADLTPDE